MRLIWSVTGLLPEYVCVSVFDITMQHLARLLFADMSDGLLSVPLLPSMSCPAAMSTRVYNHIQVPSCPLSYEPATCVCHGIAARIVTVAHAQCPSTSENWVQTDSEQLIAVQDAAVV